MMNKMIVVLNVCGLPKRALVFLIALKRRNGNDENTFDDDDDVIS
jgi:hypothetical protein